MNAGPRAAIIVLDGAGAGAAPDAAGLAALKQRVAAERVTHIPKRRPSRRIFAWAAAAAIVVAGGVLAVA